MNKKILLLTLALFLGFSLVHAQFTSRLSFGFKGGVNVSIPSVQKEFSVFSSPTSPQGIAKEYNQFTDNLASQYNFIAFIRLGRLNYIGLAPGWFTYTYNYQTNYNWSGDNSLATRFEFKQQNSYLDVPLIFKQKFRYGRSLQPYLQIGAYYSFLHQSNKYISSFETESALSTNELELKQETVPTAESFLLSNTGVLGGIGLSYQFKRAQIALETNFRYTYHNISNTDTRYDNYRTLGKFYDINDDLKMMNWSVSLVYLVDLKCVVAKIPARYKNLKE